MVLRPVSILLTVLLLTPAAGAKKQPRRTPRIATSMASRTPPVKVFKRRARATTKTRVARDLWPPFTLEHVNTREKLTLRLYDRKGRTIRASARQIWHLMRCHHTGQQHPIHWRLVQQLYRVARHYKGKTIRIYSGFRSRKVARTRTSKHTVGRAVDFAVAGVSTRSLRDYLRQTFTDHRGLGYYPNTPFVHFDIRDKSVLWVDYSGKGEEPRYARNPYQALADEKRGAKHRTVRGVGNSAAARPKPIATAEVFGPPTPPVTAPVTAPVAPVAPVAPAAAPATDPITARIEGPPPMAPSPAVGTAPSTTRENAGEAKEPPPSVSNLRSAPL